MCALVLSRVAVCVAQWVAVLPGLAIRIFNQLGIPEGALAGFEVGVDDGSPGGRVPCTLFKRAFCATARSGLNTRVLSTVCVAQIASIFIGSCWVNSPGRDVTVRGENIANVSAGRRHGRGGTQALRALNGAMWMVLTKQCDVDPDGDAAGDTQQPTRTASFQRDGAVRPAHATESSLLIPPVRDVCFSSGHRALHRADSSDLAMATPRRLSYTMTTLKDLIEHGHGKFGTDHLC